MKTFFQQYTCIFYVLVLQLYCCSVLAQLTGAKNYIQKSFSDTSLQVNLKELIKDEETFVLDSQEQGYNLSRSLEILLEQEKELSLEEVLFHTDDSQFLDFKEVIDNSYRSPLAYWGRFSIKNNLPKESAPFSWVFLFKSRLTKIDFYEIDSAGYRKQLTGTFVPLRLRNFSPQCDRNLTRITLATGEQRVIYFRAASAIQQDFYIPGLLLFPEDIYQVKSTTKQLNSGLFNGFLFMIVAYCLMLFLFERDKTYLFYCGYLLSIVVWFSFNSGDLDKTFVPLLFGEHPHYIIYFKYATYTGFIFYLTFLKSFLSLKKLLPFWNSVFNVMIVLAVLFFMADLYTLYSSNYSITRADKVGVIYILGFSLITTVFLWPLYKTKDKKGRIILLGVLGMTLGLALTAYIRFSPGQFTTLYFQIGTILEVSFFFYGLAYRRNELNQQRKQAEIDLAKSKMNEQLQEKKAKYQQEVNDLKTKLYTNITHEFRTPLTVIKGMAEQIEGGKNKKETKLIQRNSQNLLQLVNQLLDLSKLESGKLNLHLTQIDIVAFAKQEIESYIALATSNDITIHFHSNPEVILMDTDKEKWRQILSNLLSNAIKFMPGHGGKIDVRLQKVDTNGQALLQLHIQDNGIGIAADKQPFIFDRFYQVDDSQTRTRGGTGIGLSLTKELIKLMHGNITVTSKLKKWTRFEIELPITNKAEFEQKETSSNNQRLIQVRKKKVISPPLPGNMENPIALIIEDHVDVTAYLMACLQEDYRILTAKNGKEGIQTAIDHTPDVIISDVMMPLAGGFEVTQVLKNDERTSHIPIVLLTARADQDSRLTGLESGADAYLSKPFDKKELMIRLAQLIVLRKKLHSRYASPHALQIPQGEKKTKEDLFLQKLQSVIHAHLSESEFSIEDLAKAVHLSRSQLYRKTKALTDHSPASYMRLIRIHQGRQLLRQGALAVSEVAYQVGFTDPGYFSKCYSEIFGFPPKEEK